MPLKTDFFTVAQSGPTVDGREIKMSWLKDAAETYSQSKHISRIWPEHYRYMGLGEIAEVRFKEEDGVGYLQNRISPHDDLIYFVRQNRMTQPSIEIIENFAGSGKAYQYGLGATNTPASLGVGKMPLLFNTQQPEGQASIESFTQRIAADAGVSSDQVHVFASQTQWHDLEFKKEKTFFDLGRFFRREETPEPKPEEEALDMNKQEFEAAMDGFSKKIFDQVKTELKQEFNLQVAEPSTQETPEKPATVDTSVETEDHADDNKTVPLKQFNDLQTKHDELSSKVEKFSSFMNQQSPQPKPNEHGTGDEGDIWETTFGTSN